MVIEGVPRGRNEVGDAGAKEETKHDGSGDSDRVRRLRTMLSRPREHRRSERNGRGGGTYLVMQSSEARTGVQPERVVPRVMEREGPMPPPHATYILDRCRRGVALDLEQVSGKEVHGASIELTVARAVRRVEEVMAPATRGGDGREGRPCSEAKEEESRPCGDTVTIALLSRRTGGEGEDIGESKSPRSLTAGDNTASGQRSDDRISLYLSKRAGRDPASGKCIYTPGRCVARMVMEWCDKRRVNESRA